MRRIAALAVCFALLALAAPAFAASSSTCNAYNPQICSVNKLHSDNNLSSGTLPFTGLDVGLLAIGGATLLGAGLAVRRFSRRLD